MEPVVDFFLSLPLPVVAGGSILLVLIVASIPFNVIRRHVRFKRRVRRFLQTPGRARAEDFFSDSELLRHTRLLEHMADQEGDHVVQSLGLDRLWTERLYEKERAADFRRVLRWDTQRGLFACFLTALQNRRHASTLRGYLQENSDFLTLRRLALSGKGEDFDGKKAHAFLAERVDEIRELVGDPEWASRYFAVKILVYDDNDRSRRALRESFSDPHPLIRKTLTLEYAGEERQPLYDTLEDLFLHDPVFEVRQAARSRIRKDFNDLYTLSAEDLQPEEALHVVELLDPNHADDVNAAIRLLGGRNQELRLAAARFLAQGETLRGMFLAVDFADREELDRVRSLLANAVDVNVTGFLSGVTENPNPASLLLAAELLSKHGPQEYIVEVAERVFRLQEETTDSYHEIYSATIEAITSRGSEDAQRLLAREIVRRRDNARLLQRTLAGVPSGCDTVYRDTLVTALHDPDFPERDAIRAAFLKLDTSIVVPTCIDIISAGRDQHPHQVRIDALIALGELNLSYTLQDILEHLPILPVELARDFTRTLHQYQPKELERKTKMLLESVDGSIRAAVIAALPATGKKTFLSEVKSALEDADPDVRIAATWALVDYQETRAVNQAAAMLRDPVERVRESVARALAIGGGKGAINNLRETLEDENEVENVKRAVVEGLGSSTESDATDILVDLLTEEGPLQERAKLALADKSDLISVRRLVERFKDADPALRDEIADVFKIMGENAENVVRKVLEENIAGLHSCLAEILDTTGYVESRIRLLSHRDPRVRRDAASFLSQVGSEAAFRGIVMAARDPDSEVRVQVTRALERLGTDDGRAILHALENDPDRRIRKYTHWALQRLTAKSL